MVKPVKISNKYKPASLWKRFFAYLIDILLVNLIVSFPFKGYLEKLTTNFNVFFTSTDKGLFLISVFAIISVIFYFSILEYKTNQTLGKMIMNIYVGSSIGKKLNFSQVLIRNLIKPFPIVLLVDVLYMLFKNTNQRLFDVFSRTVVVEKEMIVK